MEQKPPEFKDLIGYEGLYQIHCETGDIYSIPRQGCAGGKRTPYIHNEYPTLILSKGNKSRHVLVHRIVAENLVPNPDPDRFQFVKHIDKNKLNYSPSNLKWDVLARKPKKKKAGQPPVNGEWEVSELAKEAGQVYASRHIVPASEAYADGFMAGYFKAASPPASPAKAEQEGRDYQKLFEEANGFIIDLAKELGQAGLGYDELTWGVEEFIEAAKAKFGEQEGLRWVKITEEVLNSLSREIIYPFRFNFKADRRMQWEVEAGDVFDITDTYHNGWDDIQVLLESAPKEAGQVDPVALLHWTRKKVEISHATEWLVSNVKHTDEQILSLYLESLNKQP